MMVMALLLYVLFIPRIIFAILLQESCNVYVEEDAMAFCMESITVLFHIYKSLICGSVG